VDILVVYKVFLKAIMGYVCNVSKMVVKMQLCEITLPGEKIDIVGEFELDVNVNIDCYHKVVVFKFVGFCDHVTTSANNNRQNFAL
jgi:hypothetical protein